MMPLTTALSLWPQFLLVVGTVVAGVWFTLSKRNELVSQAQAEYDAVLEKSKAAWKERAETAESALVTVRGERDDLKKRVSDLDLECHEWKNRLTVAQMRATQTMDARVAGTSRPGSHPDEGTRADGGGA